MPVTFKHKDLGRAAIEREVRLSRRLVALVGIPGDAQNPVDAKGNPAKINMASLAYIMEKGSPVNKIPPRPFMEETRKASMKRVLGLMARLQKAISSFPDIFTQTKPGKGVWYSTCLQLHRLSEGTFMAMDQYWDQAWIRKVQNRWGIPGVIQEGMGCTEAAISAVIECCNYIRKMREDSGNYWWPPMKNGRPQRMSMYEFLHTLKRNHCAYSPFIEVYGEMMATRGMAASIPGQVKAIAGDIRAASTFLSSLGISGRLMYWDGVLRFCQWYWARRDALMDIQQNRCRVHTIAAMAGLAKAWAESSGNRCMPLRFIHPEAAAWASFVRWLKMERGVIIPREAW